MKCHTCFQWKVSWFNQSLRAFVTVNLENTKVLFVEKLKYIDGEPKIWFEAVDSF